MLQHILITVQQLVLFQPGMQLRMTDIHQVALQQVQDLIDGLNLTPTLNKLKLPLNIIGAVAVTVEIEVQT